MGVVAVSWPHVLPAARHSQPPALLPPTHHCSAPRFLLIYLSAAVAGTLASYFGSPAPSLGASGAIFGIGGAVAMYYYRNR